MTAFFLVVNHYVFAIFSKVTRYLLITKFEANTYKLFTEKIKTDFVLAMI